MPITTITIGMTSARLDCDSIIADKNGKVRDMTDFGRPPLSDWPLQPACSQRAGHPRRAYSHVGAAARAAAGGRERT